MELTSSEAGESSTLDHALLESLFYNEMMMLDVSSPSSSSLLSHFSEATHQPTNQGVAVDPKTIAEKEMLRDFGVTSSPILHPPESRPEEPPEWIPEPAAVKTAAAVAAVVPSQSTHTPICPAPPAVPLHPTPAIAPSNPKPVSRKASTTTSATATAAPPLNNPLVAKSGLSIETQAAPVPHERAKQLVDQFATLASRLGIALPTNVLQSLTAAAAKNDPNAVKPSSTISLEKQLSSKVTAAVAEKPGSDPSVEPQTVEELRKTAEEAIAAVSKKRPLEESTTTVSSSKPLYSKRRKKPRLSDCESRLAELKAENELLKRHLQNVSNKAHKLEQEKAEAGKRIERLQAENADPEEMEKTINEFSDMYSDYGVNRQQELSFHLNQLQRLVNPTSFTKMGLWTLGRDSINPKRNPIAGILQKELDITPQQGRKILDQSEKIRALCDNLKECLTLLAKLKSLCEQKTRLFNDRMNKCMEILTSKQVVKLIIWINEHTQVLETVCPGWGTEHIH